MAFDEVRVSTNMRLASAVRTFSVNTRPVIVRSPDCPVSKRYGNETARIKKEYGSRGFAFLFLNPDDPSSVEAAREEIEVFGFRGRYALDPEQALVSALGVTRTTDAFLLDAARTLVYRGGDIMVGIGQRNDVFAAATIRLQKETALGRETLASCAVGGPGFGGCWSYSTSDEPFAEPGTTLFCVVDSIRGSGSFECGSGDVGLIRG